VSWQPGFCNETILYAVALCAGYLVFCFGGKWVMSNLKPFDLKMCVVPAQSLSQPWTGTDAGVRDISACVR
jgi:hypothetical protein